MIRKEASPKMLEEKAKTLREKAQLMLPTGYVHAGEPELCVRLADAEEEISYYKKMANKYTKETYLLKEEIEKLKERLVIVKGQRDGFDSMHGELEAKLGQIREHTKNFPKIEIFALEMLSGDKKIQMTKDEWLQIKRWKEQLVGLLGQNYEKPEPKKEEKQVNE